jgi:hypothetical protein
MLLAHNACLHDYTGWSLVVVVGPSCHRTYMSRLLVSTLVGEGFGYDDLPDEIGPSQPLDTPLAQPLHPQGRRRHRSPECY